MELETRFQHPFSMIVSGPSQAGKTNFVVNVLHSINELSTVVPAKVYWCYSEYQPDYSKIALLPNVELIEGVPPLDVLKGGIGPKLVILDDLMDEVSKNSLLTTLFTRGCHHWNLSCIHIVQNAFYTNTRNARINASYLVLFKSPSDQLQVANIARQMFPGRAAYFMDAFHDATSEPYGYLLVDLTQNTPDHLRLRSGIFPEQTLIAYLPKV